MKPAPSDSPLHRELDRYLFENGPFPLQAADTPKDRQFEHMVGGRWIGIKFHQDDIPYRNLVEQPMRFCEAVKASSTGPITLAKKLVSCVGALRSFGWAMGKDGQLAKNMARENGMDQDTAKLLVEKTPHLDGKFAAITVGVYRSPDILVSYIQPEAAMRFVRQWQKKRGAVLDVNISSVMSVCGNVAAKVYLSDTICLSFGCPEPRKHGGIGNDRLVIGIPADVAENFAGNP
jgi:uncharacterized protein (DUF169 family)